MTHFIIQYIVFQALFLGAYELFLKKETFFSLNRVYLLVTPFLAAIIPLLEFGIFQNMVPVDGMMQLPELILLGDGSIQAGPTVSDLKNGSGIFSAFPSGAESWLLLIYIFGVLVSAALFFRKYARLLRLKSSGAPAKHGLATIIRIPDSKIACTFFNTVFLGEDVAKEERSSILTHELVHVEQKHSWDLLWLEMLRIIWWFDPFIYRHQAQLGLLHEYIADEKVTRNSDKSAYFQDLLNSTFGTRQISFTNQFFTQSFIKNRIIMLQKPKSNRNAKWKYLMIVPLLLTMLAYVACSNQPSDKIDNNAKLPVKTIEVKALTAIDKDEEAEIVRMIQDIGKDYQKILITDGKLELIFTNNSLYDEGFVEIVENKLHFEADAIRVWNDELQKTTTAKIPNGGDMVFERIDKVWLTEEPDKAPFYIYSGEPKIKISESTASGSKNIK